MGNERDLVAGMRGLFETIAATFPTTMDFDEVDEEYIYEPIAVIESLISHMDDIENSVDATSKNSNFIQVYTMFIIGWNLAEIVERSIDKDGNGEPDYTHGHNQFVHILQLEIGFERIPFLKLLAEFDEHYKNAMTAIEAIISDPKLAKHLDPQWAKTIYDLNEVIKESTIVAESISLLKLTEIKAEHKKLR